MKHDHRMSQDKEKIEEKDLTRRLLKFLHPEGIPWPGTSLYNAISKSTTFQRNYELVARDILSYSSGGRILDVGSGPGWLLVKLYNLCPGLRLIGLDASPSMVAMARKNLARAGLSEVIQIKEGEASNIPFAESFFDLVVSTGSIHHWKDPIAGLNAIYRVLKHGGRALIYDLVSDPPTCLLRQAAKEFGKLRVILLWLHAFEEPFYSCKHFQLLSNASLFKQGRTRFVGVLCCLVLKKELQADKDA